MMGKHKILTLSEMELELPLSWRDTPAYRFVRINSGHFELKDNLPAKSE